MCISLAGFLCVILCLQGFFLVNELKRSHKKLCWIEVLYFSSLTEGSFHVCGSQNFATFSNLLVTLTLFIPQTRM